MVTTSGLQSLALSVCRTFLQTASLCPWTQQLLRELCYVGSLDHPLPYLREQFWCADQQLLSMLCSFWKYFPVLLGIVVFSISAVCFWMYCMPLRWNLMNWMGTFETSVSVILFTFPFSINHKPCLIRKTEVVDQEIHWLSICETTCSTDYLLPSVRGKSCCMAWFYMD